MSISCQLNTYLGCNTQSCDLVPCDLSKCTIPALQTAVSGQVPYVSCHLVARQCQNLMDVQDVFAKLAYKTEAKRLFVEKQTLFNPDVIPSDTVISHRISGTYQRSEPKNDPLSMGYYCLFGEPRIEDRVQNDLNRLFQNATSTLDSAYGIIGVEYKLDCSKDKCDVSASLISMRTTYKDSIKREACVAINNPGQYFAKATAYAGETVKTYTAKSVDSLKGLPEQISNLYTKSVQQSGAYYQQVKQSEYAKQAGEAISSASQAASENLDWVREEASKKLDIAMSVSVDALRSGKQTLGKAFSAASQAGSENLDWVREEASKKLDIAKSVSTDALSSGKQALSEGYDAASQYLSDYWYQSK